MRLCTPKVAVLSSDEGPNTKLNMIKNIVKNTHIWYLKVTFGGCFVSHFSQHGKVKEDRTLRVFSCADRHFFASEITQAKDA